jgi:hypothetical protein
MKPPTGALAAGLFVVILLCVVGAGGVRGPAPARAQADTEATRLLALLTQQYGEEDWQAFTETFGTLQRDHPDAVSGGLWFRQGTAQLNLRHHEAALTAFDRAKQAGFSAAFVALSVASTHAEAGDTAGSLAALASAADAGFNNLMILDSNPRLQPLHGDPRYLAVRERMQQSHPCSRPECRQFDFWVGEWNVHGPNGSKAGTNRIEPILNRCALQENWTNAAGSGGRSLNYFHPGRKKWVQVWVDAQGGVIEIEGEYRDGAMHFRGRNTAADGSWEPCRASWTLLEDGRVRQFWEQSRDGGDTWYTWFDGIYSRQP